MGEATTFHVGASTLTDTMLLTMTITIRRVAASRAHAALALAAALATLAACATGAVDSPAAPDAAAGDARADDATVDASAPDGDAATMPEASADVVADSAPPFDAGCSRSDAGLGGVGIPSGSAATASASYAANTPDLAIDGDVATYWNAGGYDGTLTITFGSQQTITGIRVAAVASPTTTETYTIVGLVGTTSNTIGSATPTVGGGVLPAISVTPGSYDAIQIQVAGMASWVAIAEVSLITSSCP